MYSLVFLFFSLFVAEAIVMLLLDILGVHLGVFWVEALVDATLIAIVTAFIVHILYSLRHLQLGNAKSLAALEIQAAGVAFCIEALIMVVLSFVEEGETFGVVTMLLDALCFSVTTTLVIYLLIYRPDKAD